MPEKPKRSQKQVRDFIATALKRFQACADADSRFRTVALDDLKFSVGEQWDSRLKKRRESKKKPCVTINRVGQALKQVSNNQRQQRPAIQVNPAGDGSSKEVAEVLQGMVRHIEVQSDAEVAYDTAFDYMLRTGRGAFRIRSEYADDTGDTLDQELVIDSILNPFSVYTDAASVKPDRSDAGFKFIIVDMPFDEYKAEYGDSSMAKMSADDLSSIGDTAPDWAGTDTVRVAEYYYFEYEEVKGKARAFRKKNLKWSKINAIEVLDERDEPGKYIPILEVVGDDLIVDGKRHIAGLVRDAKEPAKVYNYQVTAAIEVLMLAPKAPFIGWKGQFTDPKWDSANSEDWAYLEADPVTIEGLPAPSLPQRNSVESPIVAISQMIRQADNDIKATTSLYDASLGKRGPDESGKAILERKSQGDNANYNFTDNLVRTMRLAGKILIEQIPHRYDAPRIQRIINPDESIEHVGIYNSKAPGMEDFDPESHPDFQGIQKVFDIGVGRYDVTVSVGPSFQTKRQEAAAMQIELMKSVPIVQQAAPDIVIRNMDMPGADVIADRIKKVLPPQLQDDGDNSPQAQLQKAQSQLQALSQQHEQLTQQLNQATEEIRTKKVETDGRIAIAKLQEETKIAVAEITTKAQEGKTRAEITLEVWRELHGSAHDLAIQNDAQNHAAEMASQAAAQQAQQNQMGEQPAQ